MLGKRLGSLSQVLYILLGATGLPLFLSGASGLLYIFGPTGGYILGFALASYAIGKILSLKDSIVDIIVAFIIGELLILFSGAGWLWLGLRFSLREALYLGLFPFIPGDILKLIIAVFLCKKYLKRSKALFY
jgi:biotin transport system substrate-specific component